MFHLSIFFVGATKIKKERYALAVLYTALLTMTCADALGSERDLILDGSYLRDPVFAKIVAALCGDRKTLCDTEIYGIASGAALLCSYNKVSAKLNLFLKLLFTMIHLLR